MKRLLLTIVLSFSATSAFAAQYQGPLVYVGTLGDGTVFVELPSVLSEGSCTSTQVRIAVSHVAKKEFLAIATSALLSGKNVSIQADSCLGGYPTLTTASSWIYLIS